ncbi:MAG: glutamate--tRNA ligase [Actinobacteria bacterium]|nr:glutamate--tRNA ligase [Actinomycetota bacterium]
MNGPMRVRMAPSPTGDIHVGSARTTLINYLLARQTGGAFVLRIEDTDAERSDPAKEAGIFDGLRWLGLSWDEGPDVGGPYGPYRQSERGAIHAAAVRTLLADGLAYHDYTTADERAAERAQQQARGETPKYSGRGRRLTAREIAERQAAGVAPAVRFKTEPQPLAFDDLVLGRIESEAADLEDFVIARGDGSALYNMANVVDDHAMGITHVVRGKDHISNTFRQVLLYRAMHWQAPAFAHLPLVVNVKRQKLSKRDGAQWIGEFRTMGYLPEAVVNFIILLGWAPTDEREIFTLEDLTREFSLARVNRSDAVFDQARLDHFNGVWIRRLSLSALAERALAYAAAGGLRVPADRRAYFEAALALEHERLTHLTQVPSLMAFFFDDGLDPNVSQMSLKEHGALATAAALAQAREVLAAAPEFSAGALETGLRSLADALAWTTGDLFMPVRIAVTGRKATPPLFATMAVLGRDRCLSRLDRAIASLRALAAA